MEPVSNKPPLVVIVGPTASGKSSLGMELARRFGGNIIAGDSRTLYKGMDIGTAKPSELDRLEVPHYLLDIVSPADSFTAADFKKRALAAIDDISSDGRLPILVGGTGLYVDAVLHDFTFRTPNPTERQRLSGLSVAELQQLIIERSLPLPENDKNPRHLIGILEAGGMLKEGKPLRANTLIIGIDMPADELTVRIHDRVEAMIEQGLEAEVKKLSNLYGPDAPALRSTIGYREFSEYFAGDASLDEVIQLIEANTRSLAKRQRTWFRREPAIHWISKTEESVDLVTTFLNK